MKVRTYFLIVHRADSRVRTHYRTVQGLDLVRQPTYVADYHLSPHGLFTLENRTPLRTVPGLSGTPYVRKSVVLLYSTCLAQWKVRLTCTLFGLGTRTRSIHTPSYLPRLLGRYLDVSKGQVLRDFRGNWVAGLRNPSAPNHVGYLSDVPRSSPRPGTDLTL